MKPKCIKTEYKRANYYYSFSDLRTWLSGGIESEPLLLSESDTEKEYAVMGSFHDMFLGRYYIRTMKIDDKWKAMMWTPPVEKRAWKRFGKKMEKEMFEQMFFGNFKTE